MKKLTPEQQLLKRKADSFKKLTTVVSSKVKDGKSTMTYHIIGARLGITGQTVYNYVSGKGGDGYILDALIEEFENYSPAV